MKKGAKKKDADRTITAKVEKVKMVHLEMSEHEASILYSVLSHIGGRPNGPRRVLDQVIECLDNTGLSMHVYADSRGRRLAYQVSDPRNLWVNWFDEEA